jgi:hypothetical protein
MLIAFELTTILLCLFMTATLCLCTNDERQTMFQRRK